MPRIAEKGTYKRRKIVFKDEDPRLWLNTREGRTGELPKPVLELEQRRPRSRTQWDLLWSGIVTAHSLGARVETIAFQRHKSK